MAPDESGKQMSFDVVNADDREARSPGETLCQGKAYQQTPDQPGPLRDRYPREI